MIMQANFSETNQSFATNFSDNSKTYKAKVEDYVVVHNGQNGQNGATFIPDVSDDGVLSWSNDQGLPNPDPVNIKGADGKDGKDGYTPVKGVDYFDGINGKDGVDGKDGYTPVKGVDYFDGADGKDGRNGTNGERGTGILHVTTAPQGYILYAGGKFAKKRMALSTICTEAGVSKVLVGDTIAHESEHCHVYYIDSTYAYMDTVVSVRGADGINGKDGATVKWHFPSTFPSNVMDYNDGDIIVDVWNGYVFIANHSTGQFEFTSLILRGEQGDKGDKGDPYTLTEADKAEMVAEVISALPKYTGEVESV